MSSQQEAVEAAQAMVTRMGELTEEVREFNEGSVRRDEELKKYGRRNRLMIWGGIIGWCVDIALTIVIAILVASQHHTQATVADLHSSQLSGCRLGNQIRSAEARFEESLWGHLAELSKPPPHATRKQRLAQERSVRSIVAYVDSAARRAFPRLACSQIYKLGPGR